MGITRKVGRTDAGRLGGILHGVNKKFNGCNIAIPKALTE
jgi:hypothetical protein